MGHDGVVKGSRGHHSVRYRAIVRVMPCLREHVWAAVGAICRREARPIRPVRAVRSIRHHLSEFRGDVVHRGGVVRVVDAENTITRRPTVACVIAVIRVCCSRCPERHALEIRSW